MAFNNINQSITESFRSTFQQTEQGLLYVAPKIRVGTIDEAMSGLAMKRFEIHNRNAAAQDGGIGFRWSNKHWMAGQWTEVGSIFTNDTADAQDLGADDFALETTTVNDGFIILAARPFSWVSINVTTTGAATANTHETSYSNFAGTGWTTVEAVSIWSDTFTNAADYVAGEIRFIWNAPADWGKVVSIGSVPAGYYALRVRATVAAGAAALAGSIEVGSIYGIDSIATNGIYENEQAQYYDPYADAVVGYFASGLGDNFFRAEVTTH